MIRAACGVVCGDMWYMVCWAVMSSKERKEKHASSVHLDRWSHGRSPTQANNKEGK